MPIEPTSTAETPIDYAESGHPIPTERSRVEREVPGILLKAMRKAVPPEQWDGTECRLKRAFNLRLARSEESAAEWLKRETVAYNEYARENRRGRTLSLIGKAATAITTAAAYVVSKYLWRD